MDGVLTIGDSLILWYWILGLTWASDLRDWLLAGWPSADLDVGPTSLNRAAQRRKRIYTFLLVVVAPLVVAALRDREGCLHALALRRARLWSWLRIVTVQVRAQSLH